MAGKGFGKFAGPASPSNSTGLPGMNPLLPKKWPDRGAGGRVSFFERFHISDHTPIRANKVKKAFGAPTKRGGRGPGSIEAIKVVNISLINGVAHFSMHHYKPHHIALQYS
jgi:hypothetical protein